MTMEQTMGFSVNNLVTKDYLDERFDVSDARVERRLSEQDTKFEKRFFEQDLKLEQRFAEQDAKFEQRFNKAESDMRVLKWGQALVVATVLWPQLAKLVV
jgi:hypothetical protein